MDTHIKTVKEKMRKALAEYKKYEAAFRALQDICEHDWKYDGHGHKSDFYTCVKCGATKED